MYDHEKFYFFAYLPPLSSGSWSITGYGDRRAIAGYQPDGKENAFIVSFAQRERIYRFPKEKMILVLDSSSADGKPKKMKLYDYLKGHPNCEGSTSPEPDSAVFKEMDEVKDSKLVLDNKKLRIKAENIALSLNGEGLREMAIMIGEFRADEDIQLRRVLDYAGQLPSTFIEVYESPDRGIRSTIRRAVEAGLLKKQGRTHYWDKSIIGSDEDDAVSYLQKEADKLKALKDQVKKFK